MWAKHKFDKTGTILLFLTIGIVVAITVGTAYALIPHHGDVVGIQAHWRGWNFEDDYTVDSGDRWVSCKVIYEDGYQSATDEWTIDQPYTIRFQEKNEFQIRYDGFATTVTVGPFGKSTKTQQQTVTISQEEQNAALAEELIANYPGHTHDYYLELLMDQGLTYEQADAALDAAGY